MNPIFEQCLPEKETVNYELLPPKGAKNTFQHQLYYRNVETDVVYKVPNIWYNQPIQWGVDYHFGMAKCKRDFAEAIRRSNKTPDLIELKSYYDSADAYEKLAHRLIADRDNNIKFRTV